MHRLRFVVVELALLLGLVALAAAVRWPYHDLVPRYTDEVKEVMWALRIHAGEIRPLAGHNGYTGALWSYLLAALFALVGPSIALPRLVVLCATCATVAVTYALGHAIGGRKAAVVAAALLATSFVPVFVNAHVAWSVSLMPLLGTLSLLTFLVAVRHGAGWLLIVTGLLVAAAMQTHPAGVLLVPAMVVWGLDQPNGRRLLRSGWAVAAVAAAVVGYLNMIWFHVASGGESVRQALAKLDDGVPDTPALGTYLASVRTLLANLLDLLTAQAHRGLRPFEGDPAAFAAVAVIALLVVLLYAARRSSGLPLVVVMSTIVLMPLFNAAYTFPLGARYLGFLLPVIYVGVGVAVARVHDAGTRRGPRARGAVEVALAAALILVIGTHLIALGGAYRDAVASGRTNAFVHEMADVVGREHRAGAKVLLSEEIDAKFSGGGHLHRVMATLLTLDGTPFTQLDTELVGADAALADCTPACVLVLSEAHRAALAARRPLEAVPLDGSPLAEDGESYGVWRMGHPRR